MNTDLRISALITARTSAAISSSSLNTSRATYEFRSLPNNFQISEPSAFSDSDVRRFDGGGESESEGERGRFLDGIFPDLEGAPAGVACDFETGLLDWEDLTVGVCLGIINVDDLLDVDRDCKADGDLVPELDNILLLATGGCDLTSSCDVPTVYDHDRWAPDKNTGLTHASLPRRIPTRGRARRQ